MVHRSAGDVHEDLLRGSELDPERAGISEAHARECPSCRAAMAADGLLRAYLAEPAPPVSGAFLRDTCARAFSEGRPSAPLWWVALPVSWRLGLAALLVLAALGGYGFGRGPELAACQERDVVSVLESPELAALRAGRAPGP